LKEGTLSSVLRRVHGERVAPVMTERTMDAPTTQEHEPALQQKPHDMADTSLLLLEENRSLRQRLTAGILDREVTKLYQQLQASAAESAARLAIIEQLKNQVATSEADHGVGLEAVSHLERRIHQLEEQLAESETDRAARLDVIHQLDGRVHQLEEQLGVSEADP